MYTLSLLLCHFMCYPPFCLFSDKIVFIVSWCALSYSTIHPALAGTKEAG